MSSRSMRILVVSQYFWPENFRVNDMVAALVKRGHTVTVLTGKPNYPEGVVFEEYQKKPELFSNYEGAHIVRVPMLSRGRGSISLAMNYLSFFISASLFGLFRLRGQHFDAVFVYAVSPITAAIPALVIGRTKRAPVFVWVLDLWPETLSAVGITNNSRALALVGRVVSWVYNRADYLLLQSRAFKQSIDKYCTQRIASDRIIYFPSWAEDVFSGGGDMDSRIISRDKSVFTVVFAGNLGDAQDFPTLLDAVEFLRDKVAIRWVIVGDGRVRGWLEENIRKRSLNNVLLPGRYPLSDMPALFSAADALLVSLRANEVFARTVPGKVQAYLAAGRPIVAMMDGEGARVVRESGAGMACASGDAAALSEMMLAMTQLSPAERDAMGRAGRQYYFENFEQSMLISRLEHYFGNASLRRQDGCV